MRWQHGKCKYAKSEHCFRLSDLKAGSTGTVTEICKDRFHRNRIVSIGIQIGANVQVIQNSFSEHGCMIIKIYGSQIVLYRKLAEKITVLVNS